MAFKEGFGFATLNKEELFGSAKPFTTNDNGRCITTKTTRLLRVDARTGEVTADSSLKEESEEDSSKPHKCPAAEEGVRTSLFVTRSVSPDIRITIDFYLA